MRDLVPIEVTTIFDEVTINNGYLETNPALDLRHLLNSGFISLTYIFDSSSHADAKVNFEIYVSPTGASGTFHKPSKGYAIVTAAHEGSGIGSDGMDTVQVRIPTSNFAIIRATETASQDAVFSAWLTTH